MSVCIDRFVSVVTWIASGRGNFDKKNLSRFLDECAREIQREFKNYELVIVDDSADPSGLLIAQKVLNQYPSVRYIKLSRRFGKEAAISAGLDNVIGDIIVTIDPETDPPSVIPELVNKVVETNGVVFGVQENMFEIKPFYYNFATRVYNFFTKICLQYRPPEKSSYLLGMTRESLNAVLRIKNSYQNSLLRVFSPQIGFNHDILMYTGERRIDSFRLLGFFEAVTDGVSSLVTNSSIPLRFTVIGCLTLSFFYLVTSFSLLSILIFSLCLFFVLLSEYLISLTIATRQHPSYFISEEILSSTMIPDSDHRRNVETNQS